MKKLLSVLLVAVLGLAASSAYANGVFAKNDLLGSITLGFGNGFGQRVAIDYGVADGWLDGKASLGVGASVNNTIGWNFNHDAISVVANCSFHYQFVDKLDTYVQIGTGMVSRLGYRGSYGLIGVDFTSSLGARWYFNDTNG